ncbi:MAG: dihydrofolate reductase family protein, partial [Gemmatimonadaceae bacterium]|nr:dihydrofolate reductase family protein [Gemmatimonadaceae bacterium]
RDVIVGGPGLASHAFRAGLVDGCHIILVPIVVRAGTRFLPDDVLLELDLVTERRFNSGMVYLQYRRKTRLRQ